MAAIAPAQAWHAKCSGSPDRMFWIERIQRWGSPEYVVAPDGREVACAEQRHPAAAASYAPKLDPIENVWAYMQANFLNRRVWGNYDEPSTPAAERGTRSSPMPNGSRQSQNVAGRQSEIRTASITGQ